MLYFRHLPNRVLARVWPKKAGMNTEKLRAGRAAMMGRKTRGGQRGRGWPWAGRRAGKNPRGGKIGAFRAAEKLGENAMRAIWAAMVAGALAWAQFAGATSGGVDFNGCHESKKQGFHCHPERAKGAAGGGAWNTSTDRDQAARDKRLKRECKGRPNAGACLGYAS